MFKRPTKFTGGSGWICGLFVVAFSAACERTATPTPGANDRPNIVFVSIDSLRPDHLGCYGYSRPTSPFIDELAQRGVRFENAVSTTSWTLPAHAAMFTGLIGPTHGLVDNGMSLSEDHLTLAELLRSRGYHTAGFFGGPYLHPTFGLGQGFDVYESCMASSSAASPANDSAQATHAANASSHSDITGPRTRERVSNWAKGRASAAKNSPYFLFLHLWDVHYDYLAPPEYERMFAEPGYDGPADGHLMTNDAIRPGMTKRDLEHVLALYDAEIRFTDDVLKGIFADLESRGMLENTLIIITADHGEEFFEHDMKGHNKTLFDEVLRVPLIVVWTGEIEGGRSIRDQVQIIDLLPTCVSVAGMNEELAVQGKDLSALLAGRSMPARDALSGLFIDGMSQRALRSNERKVFRMRDDAPALLIDLVASPEESVNQAITPVSPTGQKQRKQGEAELREAVRKSLELRRLLGLRPPNQIEVPAELWAELKALGYVGDSQ